MVILTKALGHGEIRWKGIVIPRDKKDLFPPPGVLFDLSDKTTNYKLKVDKQYRIRLAEWFGKHPGLKKGDQVVFSKENGTMCISLTEGNKSKTISLKELLGRETREGRIIDICRPSAIMGHKRGRENRTVRGWSELQAR
jgi:hypothetical protein